MRRGIAAAREGPRVVAGEWVEGMSTGAWIWCPVRAALTPGPSPKGRGDEEVRGPSHKGRGEMRCLALLPRGEGS